MTWHKAEEVPGVGVFTPSGVNVVSSRCVDVWICQDPEPFFSGAFMEISTQAWQVIPWPPLSFLRDGRVVLKGPKLLIKALSFL